MEEEREMDYLIELIAEGERRRGEQSIFNPRDRSEIASLRVHSCEDANRERGF